eukprot:Skav210275  [mRNA]  locus=scaffold2977:50270:54259:+ [translate_table: standard]
MSLRVATFLFALCLADATLKHNKAPKQVLALDHDGQTQMLIQVQNSDSGPACDAIKCADPLTCPPGFQATKVEGQCCTQLRSRGTLQTLEPGGAGGEILHLTSDPVVPRQKPQEQGDMGVDCLSVPPGGHTFILMDPRDCIQTKPQLKDTRKPPCLSMVDSATWKNWIRKLTKIVQSYWNEQLPGIFFLFFNLLYILVLLLLQPANWIPDGSLGIAILLIVVVPVLLALFAFVGARYMMVWKNEALDKEIHTLCQQLSTSDVRVEYRTANTQYARFAFGAEICRLVAFLPNPVVIPEQQIGAPGDESEVV